MPQSSPQPRRQSRFQLWLVAVLSVLVALVSYRFLALDTKLAFPDMVQHLENRQVFFMMHIAAAPVALAVGALQFFPRIGANKPLHRWLGRIYGLAIAISGVGGVLLALNSEGGLSSQLGFGLLSLLWMAITGRAIYLAIKRKIGLHRRWIIRSFALTFAGVTLRLYLPLFFIMGYDYAQASVFLAWLCWLPNLIFAEWWLTRAKGK